MNAIAVIRLIFKHSADIQKLVPLIADAKAIVAGPDWVADRLAPSHRIIDVTYSIADDLAVEIGKVQALSPDAFTAEHEKIRTKVAAMGMNYADLLTLAQLIWNLIQFINAQRKPSPVPVNDGDDASTETNDLA